jgi:hypothetical protein
MRPKNGQKSSNESYCHPMRSIPFGMRSNKQDQVKSGEQQCGQKLNLAGCKMKEKARMIQNGKV